MKHTTWWLTLSAMRKTVPERTKRMNRQYSSKVTSKTWAPTEKHHEKQRHTARDWQHNLTTRKPRVTVRVTAATY